MVTVDNERGSQYVAVHVQQDAGRYTLVLPQEKVSVQAQDEREEHLE